ADPLTLVQSRRPGRRVRIPSGVGASPPLGPSASPLDPRREGTHESLPARPCPPHPAVPLRRCRPVPRETAPPRAAIPSSRGRPAPALLAPPLRDHPPPRAASTPRAA